MRVKCTESSIKKKKKMPERNDDGARDEETQPKSLRIYAVLGTKRHHTES